MFHLPSNLYAQDTWLKVFGGANADIGMSVVTAPDGGIVVAGISQSTGGVLNLTNSGSDDIFVVKLDKRGDVLWRRCFGGFGIDTVTSIATTLNGGYILTGHTTSDPGFGCGRYWDIIVLLLDGQGNVQWNRCYGGSGMDQAHSIVTTSDGWIIAGLTRSIDDLFKTNRRSWEDAACFRINRNGEVMWSITFGVQDFADAVFGSALAAELDGVFVVGYTPHWPFSGEVNAAANMFAILLDADGREVWSARIGGSYADIGTAATATTDGGFVVAGYSYSHVTDDSVKSRGEEDVILTKLDRNGNIVWKTVLGGTRSERPRSIAATADGGVIVTGYTRSMDMSFDQRTRRDMEAFAARYTSDGTRVWIRCFGGLNSDDSRSIAMMPDGGFVVTGMTLSTDGDFQGTNMGKGDMFVGRFDSNGQLSPTSDVADSPLASTTLAVYPNPVLESAVISAAFDRDEHARVEIVNVLGQHVETILDRYQTAGSLDIPFDMSTLPAGPYSVRIVSDSKAISTVFVVSR
ncbi:MAG: T9SS type A sorting domain-containing protein [Candidatus Kapaibacterium sp.]